MFENKILLITGGTGSFGNAVAKRFLDTEIKEIRILARSPTVLAGDYAIWNGVTTITLAKAIEQAIKENLVGLYQLVSKLNMSFCFFLIKFLKKVH